jgi:hypothetical protein
MTDELEEVFLLHEEMTNVEYLEMTDFEMMQIAVQIQRNKMFKEAYLIRMSTPSALEAIAMELGAAGNGSSIKDAIYGLTPMD